MVHPRANNPFAMVINWATSRKLIWLIVDLAKNPDPDLHKKVPRLRFRITQAAVLRTEFIHGSCNRIMQRRLILGKPNPKVVMPRVLKTRNHAGPVKPPAAIIPAILIRQI